MVGWMQWVEDVWFFDHISSAMDGSPLSLNESLEWRIHLSHLYVKDENENSNVPLSLSLPLSHYVPPPQKFTTKAPPSTPHTYFPSLIPIKRLELRKFPLVLVNSYQPPPVHAETITSSSPAYLT